MTETVLNGYHGTFELWRGRNCVKMLIIDILQWEGLEIDAEHGGARQPCKSPRKRRKTKQISTRISTESARTSQRRGRFGRQRVKLVRVLL